MKAFFNILDATSGQYPQSLPPHCQPSKEPQEMHSSNLAFRFFLEIAALVGFGVLAWRLAEGWWRYLAVIAALAFLMTLWGIFAVPDDPSRSGTAPIPVSGWVRIVLELAVLLGGACAFYWAEFNLAGIALAVLIAIHYALSGERIAWLLQQ